MSGAEDPVPRTAVHQQFSSCVSDGDSKSSQTLSVILPTLVPTQLPTSRQLSSSGLIGVVALVFIF